MRSLVGPKMRSLLTLSVALALFAAPAGAQQATEKETISADQQDRLIKVKILGMSCPFCAYGAQQKLKKLEGVEELDVELETGVATLTMEEGADVPNEKLKKTVDDAGFEAAAIVRSFESKHEDWNPDEMPVEGRDSGINTSEGTSGTDPAA